MLPPEGRDLILAGAILSILVNPFLFTLGSRPRRQEKTDPIEPPAARRDYQRAASC